MDEYKEILKTNRPHLSISSVSTYINQLKKIMLKTFKKIVPLKTLLNNYKKIIIELINEPSLNTKKTTLSALTVISEKYKTKTAYNNFKINMMDNILLHKSKEKQNLMNDKQKQNWITWDDVLIIYDDIKDKYENIFSRKKLSIDDLLNLQKYILLSCYILTPPRRILDYSCMKIKNIDKEKDNFIKNGSFNFNKFKLSDKKTHEIIKIPDDLSTLLQKWIKLIDGKSDYLFFNYDYQQLKGSAITKILNSIFKKNISCSMLRHIYISSKYGNILDDMKKDSVAMSHSLNQQQDYIKE